MKAVALPNSEKLFNEKEEGKEQPPTLPPKRQVFQSPSTKFNNSEVGLMHFFLAAIFSLL